jgi:hypothetical protein
MEDEHTCPGEKNISNKWNLGGKSSSTPESPALKGEDFVWSFRIDRKFYPRPESPGTYPRSLRSDRSLRALKPGVSGWNQRPNTGDKKCEQKLSTKILDVARNKHCCWEKK